MMESGKKISWNPKWRSVKIQDDASISNAPVARTFFSGVMVLTLSTALVKVIGLFYKIPMLHYLGSVGMGYFNAAYEWYALLCVLSTAGLPIASSMMIAEAKSRGSVQQKKREIRRIEQLSLRIFLAFGTLGSVVLFFGAGHIAAAIGSAQTAPALMAVAPTLFFSCLSAAYRGYFQGFQNMVPTAISQLIEAIGKLVLGIAFAVWATARGMDAPMVAAYAMLGLSLGVAISCFYLVMVRLRSRETDSLTEEAFCPETIQVIEKRPLWRRLISIAIPVTISSSVLSMTKIVDMAMILRRLQSIGYDALQANSLYGVYTTMAVPIFNLIPALLTSVALALIPALSSDIETGNREGQRTTVQSAIRLTALLSTPASLALAIYSSPVLHLLFRGEDAAIEQAAPMLSLLSISVLFSGLMTTTNAILQAYGHVRAPIFSMLVGALIKIVSAPLLIGIPSINIYGAPISTFLCSAVIVGINLFLIVRYTDALGSLKDSLLRPLLISLPAVGAPGILTAFLQSRGINEILLFIAAVPVTILLVIVLSIRTGLIGQKDISAIVGEKMTAKLTKKGWFPMSK